MITAMTLQDSINFLFRELREIETEEVKAEKTHRSRVYAMKNELDELFEISNIDISILSDKVLSQERNKYIVITPYGRERQETRAGQYCYHVIELKNSKKHLNVFANDSNRTLGHIGKNSFKKQHLCQRKDESDGNEWTAPYWGLVPLGGPITRLGLCVKLAKYAKTILQGGNKIIEDLNDLSKEMIRLENAEKQIKRNIFKQVDSYFSNRGETLRNISTQLKSDLMEMDWTYRCASTPQMNMVCRESRIVTGLRSLSIDDAYALFMTFAPRQWRHLARCLETHPDYIVQTRSEYAT